MAAKLNIPTTNFTSECQSFIKQLKYDSESEFLQYHQYIPVQYLINNPTQRGLLLFHSMGQGKTITAVAVANAYHEMQPSRKIIILASKSLEHNFKDGIAKMGKENELNYKFISLNASNMYTQMSRVKKTKQEVDFEKSLENFNEIVHKKDFLEDTLLIVDEAHNLFNSITNGSKNAIQLYDTIMNTRNIRLLFMSGTPIINSLFELVPCFNMLKGTQLFPENRQEFSNYFINTETNHIKNVNHFKRRMVGLISYYGDMYLTQEIKPGFPRQLPSIVEKIPMSSKQYELYATHREFELAEEARRFGGPGGKSERFSSKSGANTSTYRIKSRMASDFLKISPQPPITAANLDIYSPKIKKLIENIDKFSNKVGLVYSEFLATLNFIATTLENVKNWTNWEDSWRNTDYSDTESESESESENESDTESESESESKNESNSKSNNESKSGGKTESEPTEKTKQKHSKIYAIITGSTAFEIRDKIKKIMISQDNKHGEKISLLLISKAGAEGLDLKYIRHLHILNPFWNYSRILQIIARGSRYRSHTDLPDQEQDIQPFIYLSDYPKDFEFPKEDKDQELTTDNELYIRSVKNHKLIEEGLLIMAEASIDCSAFAAANPKIHCLKCMPNSQPLYQKAIAKDLLVSDPCIEPVQEKVVAHEIEYAGNKYYYQVLKNNKKMPEYNIYEYNKNLDAYTDLDKSNPIHADIMRQLINQ